MFTVGPKYFKLKTNLKLAVNRLKLLQKKKTELALKSRKEISLYLGNFKVERAKIRVEHVIREDYVVEAMETLEMFCDLLLARFGMIEQMKDIDPGIEEAVSSIIWAAPRLLSDIPELKVISDQLLIKYGKIYHQSCLTNDAKTVNKNLVLRLSVHAPPLRLVDCYLSEIAKSNNVPYESDISGVLADEVTEDLLKFDDDKKPRPPSNGGPSYPNGGGGYRDPSSYPSNVGGGICPYENSCAQPVINPQVKPPFSYPAAPGLASFPGSGQPPPYSSVDLINDKRPVSNVNNFVQPPANPNYVGFPSFQAIPKQKQVGAVVNSHPAQPSTSSEKLPELPNVPDTDLPGSCKNGDEPDELDFDDLSARFAALKKLK